jgi:hypothetical protein
MSLNVIYALLNFPRISALLLNEESQPSCIEPLDFIYKTDLDFEMSNSCINIAETLTFIFTGYHEVNESNERWYYDSDIYYPSIIRIRMTTHEGTFICLNSNEIYFADYCEEAERDIYDPRLVGIAFYLFKMNEESLREWIDKLTSGVEGAEEEFLGWNSEEDCGDDWRETELFILPLTRTYNIEDLMKLMDEGARYISESLTDEEVEILNEQLDEMKSNLDMLYYSIEIPEFS